MNDIAKPSPLDTRLNRVKTILEILAIPIAAYWAFTHFEQLDAPSLKIRSDLQSDLTWFDSRAKDECFAKLDIKLKNIGKTNFEVDKVTLRAWIVSPPESKTPPISYLTPSSLRRGDPIATVLIPDQLTGEYRPDETAHEDFVFQFKRNPGQVALIELEAPVKPTTLDLHPNPIKEYRWDFVCGEVEAKAVTSIGKPDEGKR